MKYKNDVIKIDVHDYLLKLPKNQLLNVRLESIFELGVGTKYALNKMHLYTIGDITNCTHDDLDKLFKIVTSEGKVGSLGPLKRNLIEFIEDLNLSLKNSDNYYENIKNKVFSRKNTIVEMSKYDNSLKKTVDTYLSNCYTIDDLIDGFNKCSIIRFKKMLKVWLNRNMLLLIHVFGQEEVDRLIESCSWLEIKKEEKDTKNDNNEEKELLGNDLIDMIDTKSLIEDEFNNVIMQKRIEKKKILLNDLKQALQYKKELEEEESELDQVIAEYVKELSSLVEDKSILNK